MWEDGDLRIWLMESLMMSRECGVGWWSLSCSSAFAWQILTQKAAMAVLMVTQSGRSRSGTGPLTSSSTVASMKNRLSAELRY